MSHELADGGWWLGIPVCRLTLYMCRWHSIAAHQVTFTPTTMYAHRRNSSSDGK